MLLFTLRRWCLWAVAYGARGSTGKRPAHPPLAALELDTCRGRVFLDGGSNTGESVRAFLAGHYHRCALNGPHRLYNRAWPALGGRERRAAMAPLRAPHSFCVRSFEANPRLVPLLRTGAPLPGAATTVAAATGAGALPTSAAAAAASLGAEGGGGGGGRGVGGGGGGGSVAPNVRYIDAALSNRSGTELPRTVVTYARNPWGSGATTLAFGDVHPGSRPPVLSSETVRGASYDVREVVRAVLQRNASSVIALKLDVEGDEFWMLDLLSREPQLLCNVSYLFVEFHNLPGMRANLSKYGLDADLYEGLKRQIHPWMEQPSCRLKVYWRSFWSACGDAMRFQWRDSPQASDKPPSHKKRRARRGRRLA